MEIQDVDSPCGSEKMNLMQFAKLIVFGLMIAKYANFTQLLHLVEKISTNETTWELNVVFQRINKRFAVLLVRMD